MDISKIELYDNYSEHYLKAVWLLISFVKDKDIITSSNVFKLSFINENYVKSKKELLIENGLIHLLPNKEKILNLSIDKADKYLNNLKNKNYDFEGIDIIFEILNNTDKLNKKDEKIMKEMVDIIISLLEKIYNLI
jgi:hypothetical protein